MQAGPTPLRVWQGVTTYKVHSGELSKELSKKMERRSHNTLSKFKDLSCNAFIASLYLIQRHAAQSHRPDTPESSWECELSNLLPTVVAKHQAHTDKGPETASILTASTPSLEWDCDGNNREKEQWCTATHAYRRGASLQCCRAAEWVSWPVWCQLGTS